MTEGLLEAGRHEIGSKEKPAVGGRAIDVLKHDVGGKACGGLGDRLGNRGWAEFDFGLKLLSHHPVSKPRGELATCLGGGELLDMRRLEQRAEMRRNARQEELAIWVGR